MPYRVSGCILVFLLGCKFSPYCKQYCFPPGVERQAGQDQIKSFPEGRDTSD